MFRGLVAAAVIVCLAAGIAAAAAWSRAPAVPEHDSRVPTGIICGTPRGDCVVPAQPVGTACTCPGAASGARTGVVLPESVARGG